MNYKVLGELLNSESENMCNKAKAQARMIAIDAANYIKKIFLYWYYEKVDDEILKLEIDRTDTGRINFCSKKKNLSTTPLVRDVLRDFELNMDPDWTTCVKDSYCITLMDEIYNLTRINWFEEYIDRTKL